MRALAISSVRAFMLVQRRVTPGAVGLVSAMAWDGIVTQISLSLQPLQR